MNRSNKKVIGFLTTKTSAGNDEMNGAFVFSHTPIIAPVYSGTISFEGRTRYNSHVLSKNRGVVSRNIRRRINVTALIPHVPALNELERIYEVNFRSAG